MCDRMSCDAGDNVCPDLQNIMLYREHLVRPGFELTTLVVIDTECIGSYKSNYHTNTIISEIKGKIYKQINDILLNFTWYYFSKIIRLLWQLGIFLKTIQFNFIYWLKVHIIYEKFYRLYEIFYTSLHCWWTTQWVNFQEHLK
jgi:hypothetical protein